MSKEQGSESAVSGSEFIKEKEMAEEKEAPKKVSRREFVKGAAAVASAGALASCAPAATPAPGETAAPAPTCPPAGECPPAATPWLPEKWDYEADVVVVGFGGAGAAAAITAADAGAKVILLEKMREGFEGGNTSASGGSSATCHRNPEEFTAYMTELQKGWDLPTEWIRPWAEEIKLNEEWIKEMEPLSEFTEGKYEYPEVAERAGVPNIKHTMSKPRPVYDGVVPGPPYEAGRYSLYEFKNRINEREIEVLYATPMTELVQDGVTKEILGVKALGGVTSFEGEDFLPVGGSEIYVKAKKGVVLCCGGFECNYLMKANNLETPLFITGGTPANTGDGHKAVEKVGAALWHMNFSSRSSWGIKVDGYPVEAGPGPGLDGGGFSTKALWVDKYGKRFGPVRKARHGRGWEEPLWWDPFKQEYPRMPTYQIFDETRRNGPSIFRTYMTFWFWHSGYDLSVDNSAEVEKGWIYKGDTIEELAEAMDLPDAALKETVTKWNEYAAAGVDPEFHQEEWLPMVPVKDPPYYGVKAYQAFSGTEGGPRRNEKCEVLDPFDKAIPRLYACGEFGSFLGHCYEGATNVGEALATGRTAARNAAALTPWG